MWPSDSGMEPIRPRITREDVVTSRPSTRMRPLEGVRNPSNALSIVLLPAPFGPRRPTAPRPNDAVTLLRATAFPYATLTASSATTGSGPDIQMLIRLRATTRSQRRSLAQRPQWSEVRPSVTVYLSIPAPQPLHA